MIVPDRAEHYAELRAKCPQLPDSHWQAMQREDALRDERDALREALARLIGYHVATGTAVPVEKLRAVLYGAPIASVASESPAEERPTTEEST
jgi:hypothetical protein